LLFNTFIKGVEGDERNRLLERFKIGRIFCEFLLKGSNNI